MPRWVTMRLQVAGRFSGLGPPGGRQAGTPGGGGGSRKMRRGFDALVFAGRGEQAGRREAARCTERPGAGERSGCRRAAVRGGSRPMGEGLDQA